MVKHSLIPALGAAICLSASAASIELVGKLSMPGSATDLSGLNETITFPGGSMPHNRLGGWGSALAYTGAGNRFIATPDRGPGDGLASKYFDRFQTFDISVDTSKPVDSAIDLKLVATTLLRDETGANLVGQAAQFGSRFDPEGAAVAPDGSIYISDEYGPHIYQFDQAGSRIRTFTIPDKFKIANPSADANAELTGNLSGRQANRGMEGLTISPDGKYLYGIMQNSLIQDGSFDPGSTTRRGLLNRILRIDIATGQTQEYVYELNRRQNGVNEILAINDHEFLVIERDGDAGLEAEHKLIYKIDITGATDVSALTLPRNAADLPPGTVIASKSLYLDLLDPAFGLAGETFPEKIEGISFGPKLADGRKLLLVTSDNDFFEDNPSQIYAFAIPVPEPATFALGAVALALIALRRRSS